MRALLLVITLLICSALNVRAADVLTLQSSRDAAYHNAVRGFEASFQGTSRLVVISDYNEVDVVRLVREERPQLVVAVGEAALAACEKVRDIPVVTILSPSLNHRKLPANVCGVNMVAEPGKYLELFDAMRKKRIGVLYDPSKSGRYLDQAAQAARNFGVTLETVEVHISQEVQSALEKLRGRIDALWVLPDSTVVSGVNMEAYIIFSIDNKVPVVSYLKQHLRSGVAASLDVDFYDIGRQAGDLCLQLIRKGARSGGFVVSPRRAQLSTNAGVLHKLGITLSNF
jgi:putative tryptophan/tyrosine transport system substrate-binding protein